MADSKEDNYVAGEQRRSQPITIDAIENAVHKANKAFFIEVKEMCDNNVKMEMQDHLIKENHFDKVMAAKMYQLIDNYSNNKKTLYMVGGPLVLLFADRILSKLGIW